jgi:hypothetical protein
MAFWPQGHHSAMIQGEESIFISSRIERVSPTKAGPTEDAKQTMKIRS